MRQVFIIISVFISCVIALTQDETCNLELLYIATNDEEYTDVFIVDANDLTTERNLTNDSLSETYPDWSPDGQQILFTIAVGFDEDMANNTLTVIQSDGTNRRDLFSEGFIGQAKWSPDGELIAFLSTVDETRSVYIINSNGNNPRRLEVGTTAEYFVWSYDSNYLAIQAMDNKRQRDIYIVSVEDGSVRNVTNSDTADTAPAWTSDGQLTFTAYGEIRILDPFSDETVSQTFLPISTGAPVIWSSDEDNTNEAIVNYQGDIWLYRDDELNNLTDDVEDVLGLDWSSKHGLIAYTFLTRDSDGSSMGVRILNTQNLEKQIVREDANQVAWSTCN